MIMIRDVLWLTVLLTVCVHALPAQSATYYISPTGSDTNPGTEAKPWLSFTYAIDPARASCGDTLILRNGTYGDGTSTGKLSITKVACIAGNELIIRAENQRQAKINDDGSGKAVNIVDSAYIIVDGLYARSADVSGVKQGYPFYTNRNDHITLKNLVGRNPNRYNNTHMFAIENSSNVLIEDSEGYVFHRHCVETWQSSNVTARRIYCNPRGGKILGGFSSNAGNLGRGDAAVAMYPCRDCTQENVIADGTTNAMYLNEMNATYGRNTLMSGSKVLGSICYKCGGGNGIYINSRNVADANHTPQHITVRDTYIGFDYAFGTAMRVSDGVNIVIDHVTILNEGAGIAGITTDDNIAKGTSADDNSITITNTLVAGMYGPGISIKGFNIWSGNKVLSSRNRVAFYPALPSSWTNTSTSDPGLGTCKVWVPAGAAGKGAGTGGTDIGANILYRYINGVLTSIPLWNPRTGEFPHGAADLDGTNRVEGESLFDIHTRLNVNTGGCLFPKNYGDGDTKQPAAPASLRAS